MKHAAFASGRTGLTICIAAIAVAPLVLPEFYIVLLNYAGIFAIAALGLTLLSGGAGLPSFGQAAFMGLAAYTTSWVTTNGVGSAWLGLAIGLVLVAIVAFVIGVATLHLSEHYLVLTTIAWGIAAYYLFGALDIFGRHTGISGVPPISISHWSLQEMDRIYFVIWSVLLVLSLLLRNLLLSRQGRAIRMLRASDIVVESCGASAFRLRLAAFVLSALIAGLAGWLYAHVQRAVSPNSFSLEIGTELLLMSVLGGMQSIVGAPIGALVVTMTRNWLQDVLPIISSNNAFESIFAGVAFILILQRTNGGIAKALGLNISRSLASRFMRNGLMPPRQRSGAEAPVLAVSSIKKAFGGLIAVNGATLRVNSGQIVGLIGPNGAGKSTLLAIITGLLKPTAGRVVFRGQDITAKSPRIAAELGVSRTFQHVKLRADMSVLENVMLGAYLRTHSGFVRGSLYLDRYEDALSVSEALKYLKQVGLADDAQKPAGDLPLGKQRLLEVARALVADPSLIILDEPAAGLRKPEKAELRDILRDVKNRGVAVLLVEHDMEFVMSLVDWIYVLNFGEMLAEGSPGEVRRNPDVVKAYLGTG